MSVLYDIQGIQSRAHAERGIARYLLESASALERWHPDAVDRYLVNPDLEVPGSVEPLTSSGRVRFANRVDYAAASVFHVGSPVELAVPLERLWPRAAQAAGLRLVATLYDLIPRLVPDLYLRDPTSRRRYETRIELIRRADRILAISEATAGDAVEHLGVRPERVTAVGTGVSAQFQRPADRAEAALRVGAALPRVEDGFLLYTGGIEPRKNIDGLLSAYAALDATVRERHQLVVVCRVLPAERALLDRRLADLRIGDRVLFTGFVPDDVLVALYQSTDLFVFPSLYEGFGLPVAEAMACGAPVAVSHMPVLTELIAEEAAQFDPRDPRSIAASLTRCLTDDDLRRRLRAAELPPSASWRSVADRTAAAYREVEAAGRRRRHRPRKRVAFVTPLPPQRSGVADDSFHLIAALAEHCDVEAVADGTQSGSGPPGVKVVAAKHFGAAEGIARGYDRVFYCMGNSEFHAGALELLRRRPGVVLAHDVRLSGLYGWAARERPELVPRGFMAALRSMYGRRLPSGVGSKHGIDFWEAERHGVLMAREVIASSEAYLVHSEHAAQLARLDAGPEDAGKVQVIPFRYPSPAAVRADASAANGFPGPVVGTFGLVSPVKQTEKLLEAWILVAAELPTATLAVVGAESGIGELERLRERTEELGIANRVVTTGDVDEPTFQTWMARSGVAVQLRAASNGETSAVVAQLLAAGVPTIVTALGSAREIPEDAVVRVDRDVAPRGLADEIIALLRDPERRSKLSAAGKRVARDNSYARAGRLLYERFVLA